MIFEIISKVVSIAIALTIVCMFLVSIAYYFKFKDNFLIASKINVQITFLKEAAIKSSILFQKYSPFKFN